MVDKRGKKFSVPGSRMTGSFHPHRLSTRIKNYIIGEGYPECFIAMNLLNEFNVLEAGGCGNVGNILKYLTQDEDNIIYVMAENGSEEVYDRLSDLYPTVRFTYPPDKSHKDFGDYFLEYTAEKTKEAILGYMVEQSGLGYKPLGILNNLHYPVFYSKLINNIVKKSTDSTESIYRLAVDSNPASIHEKSKKIMKALVNKLYVECADLGVYDEDNVHGVGLRKYKDKYLYSDGSKVIEVKKEKLTILNFDSVLRSDFLLKKVSGKKPIDPFSIFKGKDELLELIRLCDWEESIYHKLYIGFLVQSFYAGAIDFRPHLWVESDKSFSGKSWLSKWVVKYLVTNAFKREAGRSTSSGSAQAIANLAGLMACDEFAEKGTAYRLETLKMLELLRSGSTSGFPITLGSPEQNPIQSYVYFSALITCIDGRGMLEKQDFDRIVFLKLCKKDSNFEKNVLPKFNAFVDRGLYKGFASHSLKGFYMYKRLVGKLGTILSAKYEDIGHKALGLASIIAGFAVFMRDYKVINPILKELENSSVVDPFKKKDEDEDILEQILRTIVPDKLTDSLENGSSTVLELLKDNTVIVPLGISIKGDTVTIYHSNFRNFNEKYLKYKPHYVLNKLKNSKYRITGSDQFTRFGGVSTRFSRYNMSSYFMGVESDKT